MKAVVIGVIFLDIKGFPYGRYDAVGTNLGNVVMTHGGVARNVATDLRNLGADVSFVTMFDEGALGVESRKRLSDAGVRTDHAVTLPEKGMGMWLAVFNEKGDLAGSVSRMPDVKPLEAVVNAKGDEIIRDADFVVLEADTSEAIAERVLQTAEARKKPVYVVVANMSVILQRPELMAKTDCVIMNNIEAGRLFGLALRDLSPEDTLTLVRKAARDARLRAVVVTMGAAGAVFADFASGDSGFVPSVPCPVADTTGAGDAFFSAVVTGLSRGMSLRDAVRCGAKLASLTIASEESVCPRVGEAFFPAGEADPAE